MRISVICYKLNSLLWNKKITLAELREIKIKLKRINSGINYFHIDIEQDVMADKMGILGKPYLISKFLSRRSTLSFLSAFSHFLAWRGSKNRKHGVRIFYILWNHLWSEIALNLFFLLLFPCARHHEKL